MTEIGRMQYIRPEVISPVQKFMPVQQYRIRILGRQFCNYFARIRIILPIIERGNAHIGKPPHRRHQKYFFIGKTGTKGFDQIPYSLPNNGKRSVRNIGSRFQISGIEPLCAKIFDRLLFAETSSRNRLIENIDAQNLCSRSQII